MLREIKTLEDFGPTKRSTGLHQRTMDTIRETVEGVKATSDSLGKTAQGQEDEDQVSEAQHSIETCDAVLTNLDEMEGKQ